MTMLKALSVTLALISLCVPAQAGVIGMPDQTPAATLIVPYFEVGINENTHPHDTLAVVMSTAAKTNVHYQVWDVNGNPTALKGDFQLGPSVSQPFTMRGIIRDAPVSVKAQLTVGNYYVGFVTYDVVNASTTLTPKDSGYPFSPSNVLTGWIYYTRLAQGSSNGLPMVPLESTGKTGIAGFYQQEDDRERIDADARQSAQYGFPTDNPAALIDRVNARVFLMPDFNAKSKVIVFTFPARGACVNCGPGSVPYKRYDEAGNLLENTTVNLNRFVNVIDVAGTENGWVSLWNIPRNWSVYAFSINSANPPFDPSLNWDAIFEASIKSELVAGSSVTPPYQQLTGSYKLEGLSVRLANGTIQNQKDLNASGVLQIGPTVFKLQITANLISQHDITGGYAVNYTTQPLEGIVTVQDGGTTYNVKFFIAGYDLAAYLGRVYFTPTIYGDVWATMTKFSNTTTVQ